MKKHKDLVTFLRSKKLRVTAARRALLQFFLDRDQERVTFSELQKFVADELPSMDRSSVYRNVEVFKKLGLIQELRIPRIGKCLEYVFDRKVQHYVICKACGTLNRGNKTLFQKIETALHDVHGFRKANLSVVFYGHCRKCAT
ncbi:MAG: hypothetical protein A2X94_15845 [Bdellovibrionales bacterium GWB1_55_8]|nr:MAG: hypothetical protein A2X94_15845 [Bdellovibrionales bacterium GWB1_55_8]